MDLGDLVVDEEAGGGLEAGARHLLELVVGQVEAGEAGQGALVPAQARVLHILDAVVREVEVDEALEAAQLLVRQPPQARVGEPGQSAQPRQRPGLGVSVHAWRSTGETREAVAGQRGQLAVRDAEVAEAGEVLEAALGQPGLVAHQLGALDGERHGAAGGDHAEVRLIVVRVDRPVRAHHLLQIVLMHCNILL